MSFPKSGYKKGQTQVWSFFASFISELFGERERNRNRRVTRLHLAEGPAANCILDFGVEFRETGRRRNSRDADDFATRSDRELQGNLTLESRFLLQALVIDVATAEREPPPAPMSISRMDGVLMEPLALVAIPPPPPPRRPARPSPIPPEPPSA